MYASSHPVIIAYRSTLVTQQGKLIDDCVIDETGESAYDVRVMRQLCSLV
jgi:hypothetical protein